MAIRPFLEAGGALLLPLFFLFAPFLYLRLKRFSLTNSLKYLYLRAQDFAFPRGIAATLLNAVGLLLAMLAIAYIQTAIMSFLGYLDLEKVAEVVAKQPQFVLYVVVFFSPLAEEIFFRGFMQRKIGMFPAALLFGISHVLYGSIAEVIGAFMLGLLLGFYVLKRKSIAAPIFAHIFFNFLSVFSLMG